jgi:nucleotide-binding universal stress UspA family protein
MTRHQERIMDNNERGGRIVVGVDGSPGSTAATAWALDEAGRRDAALETVYAWALPTFAYSAPEFVDPDPDRVEAEGLALIDQALALVSATSAVKIHSRVENGRAFGVLCRIADEPDVRMLVVGSRGHGDLAELVLGSVSHALSHHAPAPLVIVPRVNGDQDSPPKGRVVVGVDGSPIAAAALRWAAREARLRGATLEVIVAWSTSKAVFPTRFSIRAPLEQDMQQHAQDILDRALEELGDPGVPVEGKVLRGGASTVLINRSREADMLVVGTRGRGRAKEALLGSVSHACTHHTHAPIAIVRS